MAQGLLGLAGATADSAGAAAWAGRLEGPAGASARAPGDTRPAHESLVRVQADAAPAVSVRRVGHPGPGPDGRLAHRTVGWPFLVQAGYFMGPGV